MEIPFLQALSLQSERRLALLKREDQHENGASDITENASNIDINDEASTSRTMQSAEPATRRSFRVEGLAARLTKVRMEWVTWLLLGKQALCSCRTG